MRFFAAMFACLLVGCGGSGSPSTDADGAPPVGDAGSATDAGALSDAGALTDAGAAIDGGGSADAGAPPDAGVPDAGLGQDGGASATATCATDSMTDIYSGFLPTNPYAPAPAASTCIAAPHDVIIVLGCPNQEDGTPASCQVQRADIAVALRAAGFGNRFITTGAAVHTPYVEAETLKTLLVDRGVPLEAIWLEPQAEHTDENIYYSTRIMEAQGWQTALVVSEDPGHLVMTAVCDSNCCVALGRLTVLEFGLDLGGQSTTRKVGHYVRYPWAEPVSTAECDHIKSPLKLMCTNLGSRRACADNFQLP